jgi:hypothetical protein
MPAVRIRNVNVSTAIAQPPQQWKPFHFNVSNFKDLPTTRDHYVSTPEFLCNGHKWYLRIYPGGNDRAAEGMVSMYLYHRSEGRVSANYDLMVIDKAGKSKNLSAQSIDIFEGEGKGFGWDNFIKRSDILKMLDSNGTMTVGVTMKEEPSDVYVPKNPV